MKIICIRKNICSHGKIIYCSRHPTWLPCKTSILLLKMIIITWNNLMTTMTIILISSQSHTSLNIFVNQADFTKSITGIQFKNLAAIIKVRFDMTFVKITLKKIMSMHCNPWPIQSRGRGSGKEFSSVCDSIRQLLVCSFPIPDLQERFLFHLNLFLLLRAT